mgnify:CR=1 FL=1
MRADAERAAARFPTSARSCPGSSSGAGRLGAPDDDVAVGGAGAYVDRVLTEGDQTNPKLWVVIAGGMMGVNLPPEEASAYLRGSLSIGALIAFLSYFVLILMSVMMATFMAVMIPRAAVSNTWRTVGGSGSITSAIDAVCGAARSRSIVTTPTSRASSTTATTDALSNRRPGRAAKPSRSRPRSGKPHAAAGSETLPA